jgi:hypothetical protein
MWSHPTLRLYAALSPAQQQALWQGEAVPVAQMTAGQRELFVACLKAIRVPREEWSAPHLVADSLSLKGVPLMRVVEQRAGVTRFRDEQPTAAGDEPRLESSPASSSSPSAKTGTVTRCPITSVRLYCHYGPKTQETARLTIASPR